MFPVPKVGIAPNMPIPTLTQLTTPNVGGQYVVYTGPVGKTFMLYINRWIHSGKTPKSKVRLGGRPLAAVRINPEVTPRPLLREELTLASQLEAIQNWVSDCPPETLWLPRHYVSNPTAVELSKGEKPISQIRFWEEQVQFLKLGDAFPLAEIPLTHCLYTDGRDW